MRFVGVDLSWKCAPFKEAATALCSCDEVGAMADPLLVTDDDEIIDYIGKGGTWVGIDAPLLVPNETGMRSGELEIVRTGVRILPTNRSFLEKSCGGARGEMLAERLLASGFDRAAPGTSYRSAFFETYPYSLVNALFPEGVRYKRGDAAEKRKACLEILHRLQGWEPGISVPAAFEEEIRHAPPSEMKALGDKLDAILCAACVYAHWLYGGQRTRLVGDEKDGYILIVRRDDVRRAIGGTARPSVQEGGRSRGLPKR